MNNKLTLINKNNKVVKDESIMDNFSLTFPETPNTFKKTIEETVNHNLNQKILNHNDNVENSKVTHIHPTKTRRFSKVAVAVLCILLIGGPACAFGFSKINQHLDKYGYDVPEEMINTESVTVSDEYLIIDEVYMDGTFLTFTAHLPENANVIPFGSSDHVYVNGQDCLLEQFEQGSEEPGSYFCLVNLTYLNQENHIDKIISNDTVSVEMKLYINDEWEKVPFTFEAAVDKSSSQTTYIPEQTIEIENGITAHIINSTLSPSAIMLNMTFTITGEDEKMLSNKYTYANYYVEDSNGNRMSLIDANGAANSVQCGTSWSAEINNFDMNSNYIKMIPYSIDYDFETGKEIPGTEVVDEEHAFTIYLK